VLYWLRTHYFYIVRQDPLYYVYKHSLALALAVSPVLLLIVAMGGARVARCISCCCGDRGGHPVDHVSATVRDSKPVNPCGSKLLIVFTIVYSVALGNIMLFHSLFDVADLGAMVYKAGPSFNFTEEQVRDTLNSILEPPLESAREAYANQTWWPVVEVAWDGVKTGKRPQEILENANRTAAVIYRGEGWWASAESGIERVHGWMVQKEAEKTKAAGTDEVQRTSTGGLAAGAATRTSFGESGGDNGECADGEGGAGVAGAGDSNRYCAASSSVEDDLATTTTTTTAAGTVSSSYSGLFDSGKFWEPIKETYKWISDHDAMIASWANVTGGVLGGALGLLKRIASLVGGTLGVLATTLVFFLFLDTMLTNQVDELRVVVLLLYPVASWRSNSGREQIRRITDNLRKAFEGILFVPLSLSSLYASHQLVSMTVLGLPGAGLACALTFFLSLTQLLSVAVGFVVALPWILALALGGRFYTMGVLLAFHLWGLLNVEKVVMIANKRLNRVESPYLTAFALYLGWSVFGLQGLLVGPLGLSILQVLYKSMAEEVDERRE
jgi:predicted PurR-regulated permease PerM